MSLHVRKMDSASPSLLGRYPGRAVCAGLTLLLLLGWAYFSRRPSPSDSPTKNPEVLRSELILRDGRLFCMQGTNPFTGLMVEYYPDHVLRSRSMISNGLLQGLSEGWHTNGQLEVQEYFRDGVSHGLRTKWYSDGARMSEGTIIAGKHHGTFQRWYENGMLAEEIQMQEGKPTGLSRSFYPSGFLKAEVRMTNGQPVDQKQYKDREKDATR
jgi:antitoxin component YwqK of YwqJK toxin-antitoxin module